MLSPDTLVRVYRRVQNRKVNAFAFQALRSTGLRHFVIRMDTINLCNLRCKMCYYSFDYRRKKEQMDLPLFRKIAGEVFCARRYRLVEAAAGAVADAVLERCPQVSSVRVTVHKPHAPVAATFDDVGVTIERARARKHD